MNKHLNLIRTLITVAALAIGFVGAAHPALAGGINPGPRGVTTACGCNPGPR